MAKVEMAKRGMTCIGRKILVLNINISLPDCKTVVTPNSQYFKNDTYSRGTYLYYFI